MIYTFAIDATLAFDIEAANEADAYRRAGESITSGMGEAELHRLLDPYVRIADEAEIRLEETFCPDCEQSDGCVCVRPADKEENV